MRHLAVILGSVILAGCGGGGSSQAINAAGMVDKFGSVDADQNGLLSAAEIQVASTIAFQAVAQASAPHEIAGADGHAPGAADYLAVHQARMATADKDQDGNISRAEYTAWLEDPTYE